MPEPKLSDILETSLARCRDLEAPLADRLQAFADELRSLGPEFASAVDVLVSRLAQCDAGATAPKMGEPMPAFLLPDDRDGLLDLMIFLPKARSR
jgi:hypothetical protein